MFVFIIIVMIDVHGRTYLMIGADGTQQMVMVTAIAELLRLNV